MWNWISMPWRWEARALAGTWESYTVAGATRWLSGRKRALKYQKKISNYIKQGQKRVLMHRRYSKVADESSTDF